MASKTSKLTAVNRILSNIGQSPVTGLDTGNPLVETAELILDEVNNSVQAEGWVFNTEYAYPFTPDDEGIISIADNVLALDAGPTARCFPVIRDGKLYDKAAHTYVWSGPQALDVTWLFDFTELPEIVREYITVRAANVYAGRTIASKEAVEFGNKEEAYLRAAVLEFDAQQGDYNIFQDQNGYTTIHTYKSAYPIIRK